MLNGHQSVLMSSGLFKVADIQENLNASVTAVLNCAGTIVNRYNHMFT